MLDTSKRLGIAALVILLANVVFAKPSLSVQPNKSAMSTDEFLLLSIEFEISGEGREPSLKPPAMPDWERVRVESSGTQQSISIVNGKVSRSFTKRERWVLKPLRSGRLNVGSFVLSGGAGTVRSRVFEIMVTEPGATPPAAMAGTGKRGRNKSRSETAQRGTNERIFLRWRADESEPFVGEPFVVYLDLYYDPALRPTHSSGLEQLDLSGFWTKKLEVGQVQEGLETVNGYDYRVQRLVGYKLVPLTSGESRLPNVTMVVELSSLTRRRGSFLGRQQLVPWGEVTAKSAPFPLRNKAASSIGPTEKLSENECGYNPAQISLVATFHPRRFWCRPIVRIDYGWSLAKFSSDRDTKS